MGRKFRGEDDDPATPDQRPSAPWAALVYDGSPAAAATGAPPESGSSVSGSHSRKSSSVRPFAPPAPVCVAVPRIGPIRLSWKPAANPVRKLVWRAPPNRP